MLIAVLSCLISIFSFFSLYSQDQNFRLCLVTPITQFYDHIEAFVEDTIDNALNDDTEWIVVLSKQALKHKRLLDLYVNSYKNIKLILWDRDAHSYAMINHAIAHSDAHYLTLCDIHDRRNKEFLLQSIAYLDHNSDIDLVYGNTYVTGSQEATFKNPEHRWCMIPHTFAPDNMYHCLPGSQSVWRRSLHEQCGMFDPCFVHQADYEFWLRAVAHGAIFKKIEAFTGVHYHDEKDTERKKDAVSLEQRFLKIAYQFLWNDSLYVKRSFVFVVASYNNKRWYKKNLDSILQQHYDTFRVIYVDDCSNDGMSSEVQEYIKNHPQGNRVTYIHNQERCGALANIYKAVWSCNPTEIVVIVDGDDWAANWCVLRYLNAIYQDSNVWMTYGQFARYPKNCDAKSSEVPKEVLRTKKLRQYPWVTSHMRTFYAALYKKIKLEDIMLDGTFLPMTGDVAITLPMVEMAGEHSRFISDILYVYNTDNSLSDHFVDAGLQTMCDQVIRSKKPYDALKSLF